MLHDLPAPGTSPCDHTGAARSSAPSVRESEYGSDDGGPEMRDDLAATLGRSQLAGKPTSISEMGQRG
jgi:hypothetical protein